MSKGFHIRELRITGNQKKPAILKLYSGLNIIAGASNTGKSYIFECLDFMLGSKRPPKDVPESVGYSIIELEIQTLEGNEIYTLKRGISGGHFRIKKGEIDSDEPEEEYFESLSAHT